MCVVVWVCVNVCVGCGGVECDGGDDGVVMR